MGWKASMLIINNPDKVDYKQLLTDLGYTGLKKIEDKAFDFVMQPEYGEVYFGMYKNNLLLCVQELPLVLIQGENESVQKALAEKFPDSEICSIILYSAINLWGFAIMKNGVQVRAKGGVEVFGTTLEIGEPLEEEKELLAKSTFNEEGQRIYQLREMYNDPLTEDEVGEEFIFSVIQRYFGERIDELFNDKFNMNSLFKQIMEGYSFKVE